MEGRRGADESTGLLSAAREGVTGVEVVLERDLSRLVLFHRTSWAVHVCKVCFPKCPLLLFSLLSLLPTTLDGSTQNSILNCPLGYSSCRCSIYSTDLIIFLSKRASLPVLLTSRWNAKSSSKGSSACHIRGHCAFWSLQVPLNSVLATPFSLPLPQFRSPGWFHTAPPPPLLAGSLV